MKSYPLPFVVNVEDGVDPVLKEMASPVPVED